MSFVRAWKRISGGHEDVRDAGTAEVHFVNGRVVQITCAEGDDPRGDGMVMLRAWGPKQTHDYGGGNLEDFSMVLRIGDDETVIESLRYDRDMRQRLTEARTKRENA